VISSLALSGISISYLIVIYILNMMIFKKFTYDDLMLLIIKIIKIAYEINSIFMLVTL